MFRNFVDFLLTFDSRALFKKRFNHNSLLRQLHHKLIFVSLQLFFVCMYVCSYYIKFIFRFLKKRQEFSREKGGEYDIIEN